MDRIITIIKYFLKAISFRNIKKVFIYALIPALLFYTISIIILRLSGFKTMEILRDTAQINETSSFLGFLSNIGIWLWISSAAICFFSAVSKRKELLGGQQQLLLLAGTLSLLLAVDDFFMIHDRYVNQYICYLVYALFVGLLILKHSKTIIKIEPMAFLIMGFCLMMSIVTDVIQRRIHVEYSITQMFEEGFKFLGAATWLYFNYKVAAYKESESTF